MTELSIAQPPSTAQPEPWPALPRGWTAWALATTLPSIPGLPGLDHSDIQEFVSRLRRESTTVIWLALQASVLVFYLTPVLTLGIPLPARWLSRQQVDRHANRLASHKMYLLRQVMVLLKTFAGLCWGADPAVRRALGMAVYAPDPGTWRSE